MRRRISAASVWVAVFACGHPATADRAQAADSGTPSFELLIARNGQPEISAGAVGLAAHPIPQADSCWYEYGTTLAYGSVTQRFPKDASRAGQSYKLVDRTPGHYLRDLTPGTAYHIRLVCHTSSGDVSSADGVITTAALPSPPGRAPAVIETRTEIFGPGIASFLFRVRFLRPTSVMIAHLEFGATEAYGQSRMLYGATIADVQVGTRRTIVDASDEPAADPGGTDWSNELRDLLPGGTYHYRLVMDTLQGRFAGQDRVVTTPPRPDTTFKISLGRRARDTSAKPIRVARLRGVPPRSRVFICVVCSGHGRFEMIADVDLGSPKAAGRLKNGTLLLQLKRRLGAGDRFSVFIRLEHSHDAARRSYRVTRRLTPLLLSKGCYRNEAEPHC